MRVLIVGAGWYGCHIASVLLARGCDITIVDKSNALFSGSSAKNQNRLHLGYHYPRSPDTIRECSIGYNRFKQQYGAVCTSPVPRNTYLIASEGSHIDSAAFGKLFDTKAVSSPLPFRVTGVDTDNTYTVNEEHIDHIKAAAHFQNVLGPYLRTIDDSTAFTSLEKIEAAISQTPFDYILNCTYNHLDPIEYEHYELFLTLLYKIPTLPSFACTIMDGPFYSLYPYDMECKLYTLTSVQHGVLYAGRDCSQTVSEDVVATVRTHIESDIARYIPDFLQFARYTGYYTSWKTKPVTSTDDRSLRYKKEGRVLHMYGGKITGIFQAEENVLRDLFPPQDAIVGWTGLIGRELITRLPGAALYNSGNIETIRGRRFDRLYFAGMPAEKWKINGAPAADYERLLAFMDLLKTVECTHFYLISTVDVMDCTVQQDETGTVYASHPYGTHRRELETFVATQYPDHHTIVRLPGLFGQGLKKNALYDLLHGNNLQCVSLDSEFQWYDIVDLYDDLEKWRNRGITLVQPVSEPVAMRTIVRQFFPDLEGACIGTSAVSYNLVSRYGVQSADSILKKLAQYIGITRALQRTSRRLAISNIAWSSSHSGDVMKLLERYRISNIEVAYARSCHNAVSMQSILYGTDIQLFEDVRFFGHLSGVLERCKDHGIQRIVFGSPRQRKPPTGFGRDDQIAYFRRIGDMCLDAGVVFCLEPNASDYDCTWLTTANAVFDFVRAVNHPHIRINLDTGNYNMEHDTSDVRPMFAGKWVGHIQISAPFLGPVHTLHDIDLHPIIAAAAEYRYDGYISLEMKETSMYDIALSCEMAVRKLGYVFVMN